MTAEKCKTKRYIRTISTGTAAVLDERTFFLLFLSLSLFIFLMGGGRRLRLNPNLLHAELAPSQMF